MYLVVFFIFELGVSIMDCTDDNPGEVIMELDLQWDGNPNIVLDIKTKVGVSIPVQVFCNLICVRAGMQLYYFLMHFLIIGEKYWIYWSFQVNVQTTG